MVNNSKVLEYLEKEIRDLKEEIKKSKATNELLKISIRKKELLLQKLELEQKI